MNKIFKELVPFFLASVLAGCGGGGSSTITQNDQPTDIDKSYGTQGKIKIPLEGVYPNGVRTLMQPDGKLILIGTRANTPSVKDYPENHVYISRINADGSKDTLFGENGEVKFSILGNDSFSDIKLQPDGKIIFTTKSTEPCLNMGSPSNPNSNCLTIKGDNAKQKFILARLTSTGKLDKQFGTDGINSTDGSFGGYDRMLTLQPDGKILLVWFTGIPRAHVSSWSMERYSANGAAEPDFKISSNLCNPSVQFLTIQSDGKIIVTGSNHGYDKNGKMNDPGLCSERFNADGKEDLKFKNNSPSTSTDEYITNNAFHLSDDSFIATGLLSNNKQNGIFAAHYSSNGELDTSFGFNGVLKKYIPENFYPSNSMMTPSGNLIFRGIQYNNTGTEDKKEKLVWAKFDKNGNPDNNFGTSGLLITEKSNTDLVGMFYDNAGRWLTVDSSTPANGVGLDIVVTRLRGDGR